VQPFQHVQLGVTLTLYQPESAPEGVAIYPSSLMTGRADAGQIFFDIQFWMSFHATYQAVMQLGSSCLFATLAQEATLAD